MINFKLADLTQIKGNEVVRPFHPLQGRLFREVHRERRSGVVFDMMIHSQCLHWIVMTMKNP